MKKFLNFYLDESGSNNSEFFTVAGFYLISEDHNKIDVIRNKIKSNILKIEKSIKEYRQKHELSQLQYIVDEDNNNHKEVKWNTLTIENKKFLIKKWKNLQQQNISITSNLKKWNSNWSKKSNLESIYNIMVLYLIERTLTALHIENEEDININVYIDQRKVLPKIANAKFKLESLESYVKTSWFKDYKFINSNLQIIQLNSSNNPLIRYADYFAGLINSMCRFINGSSKEWDNCIDLLFTNFHKSNICKCHTTIKTQCEIILELCKRCQKTRPRFFLK